MSLSPLFIGIVFVLRGGKGSAQNNLNTAVFQLRCRKLINVAVSNKHVNIIKGRNMIKPFMPEFC